MSLLPLPASSIPAVAVLLVTAFIFRYLWTSKKAPTVEPPNYLEFERIVSDEATRIRQELELALPNSITLPNDTLEFQAAKNAYWAKQETEALPACVVRPRDTQELCTAVTILKRVYDRRIKDGETAETGLFAVRCGGHFHVAGSASTKGGVLIDMSLFNTVVVSEDRKTASIGAGMRWKEAYAKLEEKGLTVAGGRNGDVGVGGFTLGGGISFFSPLYGFACSNVTSYEIVLASGTLTTASETTNHDLFRALKGGGNNFGIVTNMTFRTLPCIDIWSGFLFCPSSQATKALAAFHDFVNRPYSNDPNTDGYDPHAAGPMVCFTYLQAIGMQLISIHMAHTKTPSNPKKWPSSWNTSAFKSLWRYWSTCKVRTLAEAHKELNDTNPPGRRQASATTTIKNDTATLTAVHGINLSAIAEIRRQNIKGMSWTMVMQPLSQHWVNLGGQTPLGLVGLREPLVLIQFTVNWKEGGDDAAVEALVRKTVERIDRAAAERGTGHRYRFMNYAGGWQKVFEGYGEENARWLRGVQRKYDEGGLFQGGCRGGFKLGE